MKNYSEEARKAEKEGKWWEAVNHWKREGGDYGMIEAGVCQTIAESIDKGDLYRQIVGDAHERWESHELNNAQLYEIQCEAHKRVYGN
jgi:hypothetical protein